MFIYSTVNFGNIPVRFHLSPYSEDNKTWTWRFQASFLDIEELYARGLIKNKEGLDAWVDAVCEYLDKSYQAGDGKFSLTVI
jgi:hypothetical protein